MHFIVRFGQQQDALGGTVSHHVDRAHFPALRFQYAAQVIQGEFPGKLIHDAPAKVIVQARLLKFAGKERFLVSRIEHGLRFHHKRSGGRERDALIRAHGARAESDGGDVPFAHGPKAQYKTERARGKPRLVGVRHNGRIEQRRGFR